MSWLTYRLARTIPAYDECERCGEDDSFSFLGPKRADACIRQQLLLLSALNGLPLDHHSINLRYTWQSVVYRHGKHVALRAVIGGTYTCVKVSGTVLTSAM